MKVAIFFSLLLISFYVNGANEGLLDSAKHTIITLKQCALDSLSNVTDHINYLVSLGNIIGCSEGTIFGLEAKNTNQVIAMCYSTISSKELSIKCVTYPFLRFVKIDICTDQDFNKDMIVDLSEAYFGAREATYR